MQTLALRLPVYAFTPKKGYLLRDAPVRPDQLPEPEPADVETMAKLAASAFPDVPTIAEKVRQFGPQILTMNAKVESAMTTFEVDRAMAYRIASFLELAQRLYAPALGTLPLIRGIEDVYKQCLPLVMQTQEQLHVLLVNNRYQLIHQQLIAMGDRLGLSDIEPINLLQPAVERRVSGIIIVHNHPSGDPTPSTEDIEFTTRVVQAATVMGIELLDSVIVATGGFASADKRQTA